MSEAVTRILDDTKANVLPNWKDFLQDPQVGCQLDVSANPVGGDPELACTFTQDGLWGLKFDSSANASQFHTADYNVDNSVVIGFPSNGVLSGISATPTLADILHKFRVADSSGNIPFDNGSYPDDPAQGVNPPTPGPSRPSPGTLMQNIVKALGPALPFQVDMTAERNAFWVTPGQTMRADVALTFVPSGDAATALQDVSKTIYSHLGINLSTLFSALKIMIQKTSLGYAVSTVNDDTDSTATPAALIHVNSYYSLGIQLVAGPFLFWVTLDGGGINLSVLQNPDFSSPANFFTLTGLSESSVTPVLGQIISSLNLLRVSATVDTTVGTYWSILFSLEWGTLNISLLYDSSSATFTGGLILDGFYTTSNAYLEPGFSASQAIIAPAGTVTKPFYKIRDLSSETSTLPNSLPTVIIAASISYQITSKILCLNAKLIAPPPAPSTTGPQVPAPFTWDELDVRLAVGPGSFSCTLATDFLLTSPLDQNDLGMIGLNFSYQNKSWLLSGLAQNINGAMLSGWFDPNYNESLLSVLGKLQIPEVRVVYTYADGGAATSFAFVGTIQVGLLQLRLFYQYVSSDAAGKTAAQATPPGSQGTVLPADAPVPVLTVQPSGGPDTPPEKKVQTDWTFECDLGASAPNGQTATLGAVIDSIVPGVADSLPTFVSGIKIPSAKEDHSPVTIKVTKHGADQVAFAFQVEIEHVSFTFAQIGDKDPNKTKRLIRVAVGNLPALSGIPLIGDLIQPFDALEYLWVNDSGGLLESEATVLNKVLPVNNPLYFSATVDQSASAKASSIDSVVIVPGHHFILIQNQTAVLDHVFATANPTVPQPKIPNTPTGDVKSDVAVPSGTAAAPASPPSKGELTLTLGPLTISAISLQFQEQGDVPQISITLDATFAMGPILLELISFGFVVPLDGGITLDNLASLVGKMSPVISGMVASFNQPPLLIAGGFEHVVTNSQDTYLGAIGISFPPYNFIGVGEYAVLHGFKSIFLYAKLNGPLITLEFGEITGVRMGFGYNSFINPPAIDQLTGFPFIDDTVTASAGSDPFLIVQSMTQTGPPWVTPKEDEYWLVAGLLASLFDCLTVTAVAMLEVNTGGFDLAIYGDAVAMMPPDSPSRDSCLVYVELAMVVEFNMNQGYFRVEAALAPTSFLLVPQCQLTGGFALIYWFGSNQHAGDWVFSVGGYHPQYQVPEWYPVPQRLQICFTVGSCLSVVGNCYFAVTPKVVMGGALIHVSLDLGPLQAWLDAQFDCLINFHPLHYMAQFSVSVGVSFNIDILFIHIHIGASIGAVLVIQGPEFGGTAHVDFWAFGFTIDFGASPNAKDPLTLLEFWQMVHQPGPAVPSKNAIDPERVQAVVSYDPRSDLEGTRVPAPSGAGTVPRPNPAPEVVESAALKFALEDGNYPNPPKLGPEPGASPTESSANDSNAGQGTKWFVNGGTFKFRIQTDFALSYASVAPALIPEIDGAGAEVPVLNGCPHPTKTNIFSRPMQVTTDIVSELSIVIMETVSSKIIGGWTGASFDMKSVPTGTWGKYSRDTDPSLGDASSLFSHEDASVPLPMGLLLSSPAPRLALSTIPTFSASDAAKMGVVDLRFIATMPGTNWFIPDYDPIRKAIPDSAVPGGLDYVPVSPDLNAKSGVVMAPTQITYTPAELSSTEESETNQQLWDNMGNDWVQYASDKKALVNDPTDGLLVTVEKLFGWAQSFPGPATSTAPASSVSTPWKLKGDFPAKLVRSANKDGTVVKGLETTYLALPRHAVEVF
ncbi:hypothetical protein FBEOM_2106 [Fusarium beomiforme]|uniref:DUF6603 domain-containing protein n=1 Tax=Fusarium beomiforme TaxID=44412 RepID=A0A9P5E344_9HYPO|nr:hypothetical protein FBEOM_2106 [Fusarium beomiforme]